MKATCPRLFEVEALRDGRLSGPELARFQDHLGACAVCSREAEALAALATRLRDAEAPFIPDELHVRRERTRLLAAFDASLVPAPGRRVQRWVWSAAVAAVFVLAGVGFMLRESPPAAPLAQTSEPVFIRSDSGARWSRQTDAQFDRIRLEQGALSIRVQRATPEPRVLVVLPDGELEDIGTTFSVSVDAGRTTSVSVQEGSVVLRLVGEVPRVLGAGERWSPQPASVAETGPAPSPSDPLLSPSLSSQAPSSSAQPALGATGSVRRGVKPLPAAAASLQPADVTPDAAADFRAAMTAFNRGRHQQAAALFATFLAQHPGDARAEDAAYLRVLAAYRSGNTNVTHRAARDYLTQYPQGFRHAEVEALARP